MNLTVTVFRGIPWGNGVNQAASESTAEVLLLCADDMVPHPGYLKAGLATVAEGRVPMSHCVEVDGKTWLHAPYDAQPAGAPVDWTRMFLLRREWFQTVGPFMEDMQWYIDRDYSERLNEAGYQVTACPGFRFTHLDPPRNWYSRERDAAEREMYLEARRQRGQ